MVLSCAGSFGIDGCHIDPKFLNRQVLANSKDPVQTAVCLELLLKERSDQGLPCLPFCLHLLDALLYEGTALFKF